MSERVKGVFFGISNTAEKKYRYFYANFYIWISSCLITFFKINHFIYRFKGNHNNLSFPEITDPFKKAPSSEYGNGRNITGFQHQ